MECDFKNKQCNAQDIYCVKDLLDCPYISIPVYTNKQWLNSLCEEEYAKWLNSEYNKLRYELQTEQDILNWLNEVHDYNDDK